MICAFMFPVANIALMFCFLLAIVCAYDCVGNCWTFQLDDDRVLVPLFSSFDLRFLSAPHRLHKSIHFENCCSLPMDIFAPNWLYNQNNYKYFG